MWQISSRKSVSDIRNIRKLIVSNHPYCYCSSTSQRSPVSENESPHQPPTDGPSSGRPWLKYTALGLLGGGGLFVGLGYYDKSRSWIVDNVPQAKSIYDKLGLSGKDYENSDQDREGLATKTNVSGRLPVKKGKPEEGQHPDSRTAKTQEETADRDAVSSSADRTNAVQRQRVEKAAKNQELETRASKGVTLVLEFVDESIKFNKSALEICKQHVGKLKEAVDARLEEHPVDFWSQVKDLDQMRHERVELAYNAHRAVEDEISKYLGLLDAANNDEDTRDNRAISNYREQVQQLLFEARSIHEKLKAQESVVSLVNQYYSMIQQDKSDFKKEVEAILPGAQLPARASNMSQDEMNILLVHAHRRISQLKQQLIVHQTLQHEKLERTLSEHRDKDEGEAARKINKELENQKTSLERELQQELVSQAAKFESESKEKLARQANDHQNLLQQVLTSQQKRLSEEFDVAMRERLIFERYNYIVEISKQLAKIKGVETALQERAELGAVIVGLQDLMSSAMCLMNAVTEDEDCRDDYKLIKLDGQLKRCVEAGGDDSFVQSILEGVPKVAGERGIYSISSLEKRFDNVFRQCSRVAFYPDTDSALWRFFGYIRYYMQAVSTNVKYSTPSELDSGLSQMTPTELLQQAKYFIDKKCLPEAVTCLVQLTGNPRALAQDWIEEARLVLEVRQAAQALLAYTHAQGIGIIF